MGKLYIVATPIGNMEDITLRAIRILKEVDLIICENVSVSHRLLKHYDINTPTTNYYSHTSINKTHELLDMLVKGKSIAMISDAGTPCISDPGFVFNDIVGKYNENTKSLNARIDLEEGYVIGEEDKHPYGLIEIIPIPGATAITALYSIANVSGNRFSFYGFVPHKNGRQTFIKSILQNTQAEDIPIIFYESVHRFEKLLEQIELEIELLSKNTLQDEHNSNKNNSLTLDKYKFTVGRELTKIHEQVITGNVREVKEYFANNKDKIRGEFVIMLQYVN